MKGILRKTSLFGLTLATMLGLCTLVKADKTCVAYNEYYFFSRINEAANVTNQFNNYGEPWTDSATTYYPSIWQSELSSKIVGNITEKRVCLKNGDKIDGTETFCNNNTWNLTDFYDKYKEIESKEFQEFESGDTTRKYKVITEETTNGNNTTITKYYTHGNWYRDDGTGGTGQNTNVFELSVEQLVKISALAVTDEEGVKIESNLVKDPKISITRKMYRADFADAIANAANITVFWNKENRNAVLSPSLYHIEYTLCGYDAVINYYYFKDGSPTTDRVKDDDGNAYKYEKNNVDNYEESVPSPKIKGCTIVDTNGNEYPEDKVVEVKVAGSDFSKDVYYYCPTENKPEQVPTGDFLIYFVWAIGLGAIGYSIYYFKNLKKDNKEEI